MKIVRNDPQHLVIVDFSFVIGGFFTLATLVGGYFYVNGWLEQSMTPGDKAGGGLFLVVGVLLSVMLMKRSVFDFDRSLRQLIWKRRGFFGVKGATVPFDEIESAYVGVSSGEKGVAIYRVALKTRSGVLPLNALSSSGIEPICKSVCDAINQVLGKTAMPEAEKAAQMSVFEARNIVNEMESQKAGRLGSE
jgi:hypothetical protein